MHTRTVDTSLLGLRSNLTSFIEQAHYTDTQIRLIRHKKPIARIISESFMSNIDKLLAQDSSLRETLEVMSDANMLEMIAESKKDLENGNFRPLVNLLKE